LQEAPKGKAKKRKTQAQAQPQTQSQSQRPLAPLPVAKNQPLLSATQKKAVTLSQSKPRLPARPPLADVTNTTSSTVPPELVSRVIEASILAPAKTVTRQELVREYILACLEDPNFGGKERKREPE
jgi:hypothetical protein